MRTALSTVLLSLALSAQAQTSLEALQRHYLACDAETSQRRLAADEIASCSAVAEELLQQGFGGDLDALLAWWRSARQEPRADPSPLMLYALGQQQYALGHHAQAFEAFAQAADAGHRDAARIALLMQRKGRVLYGQDWPVPLERRERWARLFGDASLRTAARPERDGP